jgi:hypothetical protein
LFDLVLIHGVLIVDVLNLQLVGGLNSFWSLGLFFLRGITT